MISEETYHVAWFTCGTHAGKYKGIKMGVVLGRTKLGDFAKIGVAASPLGDGDEIIDAAYIYNDGAEIDVKAAELIILMHNGRRIYID
jgi:hypothetical protein